jgi:hypothetical protein
MIAMTRRNLLFAAAASAAQAHAQSRAEGPSVEAKVTYGGYRGSPSLVIETGMLRAEFVVPGARMVSLRDQRLNHEFLFQQESPGYLRGEYDSPMANNQAAGYDDMFPTITECYDDEFPWKGTRLPDHGEAWSLNWDCETGPGTLRFALHGIRLPYRLTRLVTASGGRLRLAYRLENLSAFSMSYLWSAHPMLRPEPGSRILLPEECRTASVGGSHSGRLGKYGDRITWPDWVDSQGRRHDLSVIRASGSDDTEAYYFTKPLTHGWCGLTFPSVSRTLRLSFPVETVPFLGVVLGEGLRTDPRYFAILEPCSVPYGRLDIARMFTQTSTVGARQIREWFLEFQIEG